MDAVTDGEKLLRITLDDCSPRTDSGYVKASNQSVMNEMSTFAKKQAMS